MRIRYALIVLLAVLLTGCASFLQPTIDAAVSATLTAVAPTITPEATMTPVPSCAAMTAAWLVEVEPLLEQWDDALVLAGSTARVNLSGPVGTLQQLARDIKAIEPPICAVDAYGYLVTYLDAKVDKFLLFMSQANDMEVGDKEVISNMNLEKFLQETSALLGE